MPKKPLIRDPKQINEVLTRGVDSILPKKASLAELMTKRRLTLYLGIDPTASTLHLGHSVPLRKLQDFAELGHQVILLVGNGTVKIGDPTGRDDSRPILTDKQIATNFANWKKQASKILDFSLIEIRYNGDWLDKLSYSDMVKLLAKTTVQQLLERDMFQKRLKKGLPIHGHEIIYPLLQGYDSVVMKVDLEVGGTDQTFNMMMGRHLQQVYNQQEKWVLTVPLIEGTDGRKMSKSFNNFVALTENPVDMYGRLMRVNDDLIVKYFELLTRVDLRRINKIKQAMAAGDNPMIFKKELAMTITSRLHSPELAQKAAQHFDQVIQHKVVPSPEHFTDLKITVKQVKGQSRYHNSEFTNSQFNRLLDQGAVKVLPKLNTVEKLEDLLALSNGSRLKIGKRRFYRLSINKEE